MFIPVEWLIGLGLLLLIAYGLSTVIAITGQYGRSRLQDQINDVRFEVYGLRESITDLEDEIFDDDEPSSDQEGVT